MTERILTRLPLRVRVALAVVLVAGIATGASLAGAGGRERAAAAPAADAPRPGEVLRDALGHPILDSSGRPVRVAHDGRTVVDSRGRVLHADDGRPITVASGSLPVQTVQRAASRPRRRHPRRQRPSLRPARPAPIAGAAAGPPVVVGIAYEDPDTTVPGLDYVIGELPDGGAIGKAVVDYVNRTGGVGGRPMVLRAYKEHSLDGRSGAEHVTELCNYFADGDRPLFITANSSGGSEVRCLAANGIGLVGGAPWAAERAALAAQPTLTVPGAVALDRWEAGWVDELVAQRFFAAGARVGIAYVRGWSAWDAGLAELKRALADHHIAVVDECGVDNPETAQEIAPALRDVGTCAARAHAKGVNRVMTIDRGIGLGYYMRFAESQGWRPRYAINTTNAPTSLVASAPEAQLHGSVGIGWAPLIDVDTAHDPGAPATRAECIGIFDAAGIPVGSRSLFGAFASLSLCDAILMARAALERSGDISLAGLRSGMDGLRRPSAMPLVTRLDTTHPDGAAGYRAIAYDAACRCFVYSGPTRLFD